MHTAAQYEESGGSVTVSVGEGGATARPDAVAGAPLGRRAGRRLPRNSRSTTSRFRLALHRCPGAKAPAPTAAGTSARPNAVARVSQQGGWVPGAPTPDHETRLARRSPADRLPPRLGRPSFLRRSSRDRRNRPTYNEKTAVSPGAIPECEHWLDWVAEGAVSSEPVSPRIWASARRVLNPRLCPRAQ